MKPGWVYILHIDVRIIEHKQGIHKGYTYSRRPVRLLWSDCFPDMDQAIQMEKRIKGWRREKKEALIAGNFDWLPELSKTAKHGKISP
jgi:putative endonuclease